MPLLETSRWYVLASTYPAAYMLRVKKEIRKGKINQNGKRH
jgi:hypothetical protein